jgi:putative oxidoreductase
MNDKALRFLGFGLGVLLLFHGIDKVMHGTEFIEKMLVGLNVPYSEYVQYGVYIGEIVAPLLLIFGQYMRVSGAIIAFNMLVAIFLVHQKTLFTLGEHGAWSIEVPMLYLVAGVTLALWKKEKKSTK